MPVRTNGGVFCDQVLTGSLKHFRIYTADFTGAVDANGTPLHGSAAEIIFTMLSERATIAIMNPVTNPVGISLALETNRADWSAAQMEADIRALGTIGIDNVDVSTITVEQVYYNLLPLGAGSSDFLGLTDTPSDYTGHANEVVVVNATEDGLIFVPGGISGAVDSVFGRTGTVVAQAGDYDAVQVDYSNASSGLAATDVQAAIDELDTAVDINTTNITNIQNTLDNLALDDIIDVDTTGVTDGQVIAYDQGSGTWLPVDQSGGTGAVDSVFGRTGVVVAEAGDYDSDEVDNASTVPGATVSDALGQLESDITAIDTSAYKAIIGGQETIVFDDTVRGKTLSVSENPVMFSDNRLAHLQWVRIGNTSHARSGYVADFKGTITYATAHCEDTNASSKDIHVFVNGVDMGAIGTLTGGVHSTFINTTLDIDFDQGDLIRLRAFDGITGKIEDTVIKIILRWRV